MKTTWATCIAFLLFVAYVSVANSDGHFVGDWRGEFDINNGRDKSEIRVVVLEDDADNFYCFDGVWEKSGIALRNFRQLGNNALLIWIQKGTIWTETQIFSLSHINGDTLELVWTRHVNNIQQDEDDETWHVSAGGTLKRFDGSSVECG